MSRALSIRLPVDLYQEIRQIAEKRQVSFNALVQESLTNLVRDEKARRLYEAFGEVGGDYETSDVEYALHAQEEALGDDE